MGVFRRRREERAELARLTEQVEAMRARLDATGEATSHLGHRVDAIDHANMTLAQQVGPVPEHAEHLAELAERIARLDERVTSVATELANQLNELGTDIEALQKPADAPGHDDGERLATEVLDALESGQERLANEQARYQIAFREDLARLAEDVRRSIRDLHH